MLLFAVFRYVWFYCLFVEICFCLCWVCVYAGCLSLVDFVVLMFCFCLLLVLQVLPGLILAEFACYLVVLLPVVIVVIWHDCGVSSLWWFGGVACGGLCVCFRMCLIYGLVSVLIVGCLMRCWFSVVFCVVLAVFVIVAVRLFLVYDLVLIVHVWFWCWLACCMFGFVRGFGLFSI